MKVVVEKKDQAVVDRWIFSRLDPSRNPKIPRVSRRSPDEFGKSIRRDGLAGIKLNVTDTQSQFQFFS